PQGKHIGIVGRSGAGKTTLIHLLLRYWEYDQGSILLNGSELRSYNSDDWRKHMAVVSQNTHLFNATLRENLLLAQADASDERILEVINQAQLDEVVKTLPEGLNTWLGEQGVILSAGERQRVAIARALLKDAPIMILDEATANLDAITERKVLDALEKAVKGKSLIMVSHGRNGMEGLDEVIELG
ncbi:MAG: ATP-binding cassette domain-containing protein, partial [Anaerolineaceae bacterium]